MPGRDTAPRDGGIQQGVGHRRQWCPGDGAPLEENGVEKSLVLHEMVVLQETVDSGDGGAQDTTVLCAHGSQGTLVLQKQWCPADSGAPGDGGVSRPSRRG